MCCTSWMPPLSGKGQILVRYPVNRPHVRLLFRSRRRALSAVSRRCQRDSRFLALCLSETIFTDKVFPEFQRFLNHVLEPQLVPSSRTSSSRAMSKPRLNPRLNDPVLTAAVSVTALGDLSVRCLKTFANS